MTPRPTQPDEFYVGYLPMPKRYGWLVRVVVCVLIGLTAFWAGAFAGSQLDPGDAIWDTAQLRTWEGVIDVEPYPLLRVRDTEGQVHSLPLVEMGKFGGGQRAAAFAGQWVSVQGYLLSREGRQMIELNPEEPGNPTFAVKQADVTRTPTELRRPQSHELGSVKLRGEIIDSKCFLGAMKPGHGKTHKECATLCIAGGIPAMLVTHPSSATPRGYYLLCDVQGQALGPDILPFVADDIEISGEVEQRGDLRLLRIDSGDIRRR